MKHDWDNFDQSEWTNGNNSKQITNMPDGTIKITIQPTYMSDRDIYRAQMPVKLNRHDRRANDRKNR